MRYNFVLKGTCAWTRGDYSPPDCPIYFYWDQCAWRDYLYNLNSVKRYFWGKKKPPFNLRVTETWVGCVNHDLKVKRAYHSCFIILPCHQRTPLIVTGLQGYWQAGSENTHVKETMTTNLPGRMQWRDHRICWSWGPQNLSALVCSPSLSSTLS